MTGALNRVVRKGKELKHTAKNVALQVTTSIVNSEPGRTIKSMDEIREDSQQEVALKTAKKEMKKLLIQGNFMLHDTEIRFFASFNLAPKVEELTNVQFENLTLSIFNATEEACKQAAPGTTMNKFSSFLAHSAAAAENFLGRIYTFFENVFQDAADVELDFYEEQATASNGDTVKRSFERGIKNRNGGRAPQRDQFHVPGAFYAEEYGFPECPDDVGVSGRAQLATEHSPVQLDTGAELQAEAGPSTNAELSASTTHLERVPRVTPERLGPVANEASSSAANPVVNAPDPTTHGSAPNTAIIDKDTRTSATSTTDSLDAVTDAATAIAQAAPPTPATTTSDAPRPPPAASSNTSRPSNNTTTESETRQRAHSQHVPPQNSPPRATKPQPTGASSYSSTRRTSGTARAHRVDKGQGELLAVIGAAALLAIKFPGPGTYVAGGLLVIGGVIYICSD